MATWTFSKCGDRITPINEPFGKFGRGPTTRSFGDQQRSPWAYYPLTSHGTILQVKGHGPGIF